MAFFRNPAQNGSNYDALRMVTDWLNGGSGPPANIVGVNDDSEYAVTLDNQGTGGHLSIPGEFSVASDGSGTVARLFTATSLVVSDNTTLGSSATDTLTVNATSTFAEAVTLNKTLSVKGNATIGDAAGDAHTVNGTLAVTGDFSVSTNGFAVAAATNKTRVNLAAIIGAFDLSVGPNGISTTGNNTTSASLIAGATALVGGENLRVVGSSRLEGGVTVTTGNVTVSTGSLDVTAGGISAGASSAFTGGVSVITGGLSVLAGGITPHAASGTPAAGVLYTDNVPKAWGNVSGSTTTINGSFNVSSVTDSGASGHQINLDRDFANTNYAAIITPRYTAGGTAATTLTVMYDTVNAGAFIIYCHRASDGAHVDPTGYSFACFGVQ